MDSAAATGNPKPQAASRKFIWARDDRSRSLRKTNPSPVEPLVALMPPPAPGGRQRTPPAQINSDAHRPRETPNPLVPLSRVVSGGGATN